MAGDARQRWRIEDLLDRTDLAALLDEQGPSGTAGPSRRWHCPVPDHDDHHASVTMHTDARGHQRWRCWSGDQTHRGDAIDLVMVTRHLDRAAAITLLADRAGLERDTRADPGTYRSPRFRTAEPSRPRPLDPLVVDYVNACERILWTRTGRPALDWLASRGLDEATLRANRVGADPGRDLLRRGTGLPRGRGPGVTFPALDPARNVNYVQTRNLHPEPDGPKYENPASRLGTNPRLAWTHVTEGHRAGPLVVCEGIPDALTASSSGLRSVALLGAQTLDTRVIDTLAAEARRPDSPLVAIIDADPAGRAWGARLAELLEPTNVELQIVEPPGDGLDLNAWALQDPGWVEQLSLSPAQQPQRPNRVTATELGRDHR